MGKWGDWMEIGELRCRGMWRGNTEIGINDGG